MHITFFIATLLGGGAERVVANLSNYLSRQGYCISILNYRRRVDAYDVDPHINRKYLIKPNEKRTLMGRIICRLFKLEYLEYKLMLFLKKHKTNLYVVMLEEPTIYLLKMRRFVKVPIIASERNYPGVYPKDISSELYRLSARADGYVFQTPLARDWYGKQVKDSVLIPNAVSDIIANYVGNMSYRSNKIINVGRLYPEKNHELLIRSFKKANLPDYCLEIYGIGPLENQLKELINNMGLSKQVFLKGFSSNISEKLNEASIFVLSSKNEGIPNALLEAMSIGKPCITTDFIGGGAHILIDNGIDGLIVENENEDCLANAMRRLINDVDLANAISNSAREKAKVFSSSVIFEKWKQYFIHICGECKK